MYSVPEKADKLFNLLVSAIEGRNGGTRYFQTLLDCVS